MLVRLLPRRPPLSEQRGAMAAQMSVLRPVKPPYICFNDVLRYFLSHKKTWDQSQAFSSGGSGADSRMAETTSPVGLRAAFVDQRSFVAILCGYNYDGAKISAEAGARPGNTGWPKLGHNDRNRPMLVGLRPRRFAPVRPSYICLHV